MTLNIVLQCEQILNFFRSLREAIQSDLKGWVICAAVLLITVIRSGITYSFGLIVVELEKTYHRPLAEQNWIGTLSFCISLCCSPFSVALIRKLKYRGYRWTGIGGTITLTISCLCSSFVQKQEWLFLTHSLLYGIGSSLIYMASSLVIGEYFDKHHRFHVLATSILLCGYPVGSLLFNPINASLVSKFGWRTAFRMTSALLFVSGIACCWTFTSKDTPNMQRLEEEEEEDDSRPATPRTPEEVDDGDKRKHLVRGCRIQEVRERPEIMFWYLGNMLSYLGFFMPFLNLAYYMDRKHITIRQSGWALTLLSLAECLSYILSAFLGDWLKGRLVYVNVGAAGALSVICITWPFVDVNYGLICMVCIGMGAFLGLTIVYTYAASGEVTQLPIDVAWSFTNLWSGFGILLGPFFSGAIFDLRKSYDDVFYTVGALYFLDCIMFAAIPALNKYRNSRKKLDYNEIAGVVGQHTQTFRITKKSISRASIGSNDENVAISEDATTQNYSATEPVRPPPPSQYPGREYSGMDPFGVGKCE